MTPRVSLAICFNLLLVTIFTLTDALYFVSILRLHRNANSVFLVIFTFFLLQVNEQPGTCSCGGYEDLEIEIPKPSRTKSLASLGYEIHHVPANEERVFTGVYDFDKSYLQEGKSARL